MLTSRTFFIVLCGCVLPALAQQNDRGTAPIYRVTVEQRTVRAVNYGHRSVPTKIGFRGTVLLPQAKGEAKVESRAGVVEVDSKFEGLEAPTRFGPQYLTYVLWAITPDGRPVSLGEVITNGANKAKLKATTQLQAFGLIVTAEPYFAVTQPSNVVVLENVVRPDTTGTVEEVEAKYELLPRSDYPIEKGTIQVQQSPNKAEPVSQDRYEAIVALYQALNALQIARAQGADRYAPDTMQKADQLYEQARQLQTRSTDSKQVVTIAREAAQTAEDARTIALKRGGPQPSQARQVR